MPDNKSIYDYREGCVSVIIPTYNYQNFIATAIDSVLEQCGIDKEIIVVDDGSSDRTYNILERYKKNIKYIYKENAGLSAARNTGIKNSSGEFILFLDADDVLGPDVISSQLKYLENNSNADVVVCQSYYFQETTPEGRPKPTIPWILFKKSLAVHLCYFNIAPPHAFLFRREAIIQTGWFDTHLKACEDYDFWLRAAMKGFIPQYNHSGLVYYRRHHKSMSADLRRQYLHDAILHKRLSVLLDQNPHYPENQRLEALLAFSAGVLQTIVRLDDFQLDGGYKLLEYVFQRLNEAKRIAKSNKSSWNILLTLFCLRIMCFQTSSCFVKSNRNAKIKKYIQEITASLNINISRPYLLAEIIISALVGSNQFVWERQELRRLLLKYLKVIIRSIINIG
ncbi:MAG: glycosyltransferase family 2 protein [Pseudomonadota bacterium]